MFRKKTVLIIGAGASAEFSMPLGSDLLNKVSQSLLSANIKNLLARNFQNALIAQLGDEGRSLLQDHGKTLSNLSHRFKTMDAALHFLSNSPGAVKLGKLAIAYHMVQAERDSKLAKAIQGDDDSINRCDQTWASQILSLAMEETRRGDFVTTFSNLTVIDFNYDRVFLHYLYWAMQRLYTYNSSEAAEALSHLKIFKPYGSIGRLDWEGHENSLPFAPSSAELAMLVTRLRTFTEEQDSKLTEDIRNAVGEALVAIVLGFGFHRQNLKVIRTSTLSRKKFAYMSVYKVGKENHEAIALHMTSALGCEAPPKLLEVTAYGLLRELGLAISLAAS